MKNQKLKVPRTAREWVNEQESKHTPTPWKLDKYEFLNHDEQEQVTGFETTYLVKDGNSRILFKAIKEEAKNNLEFIVRAVNSHEALLEAAKDALCELDPDCNFDGSNYKGEPSDKGNSRIQTILALYKVIAQAEAKP